MQPPAEITQLLIAWNQGDQEALDQLIPLIYDTLHQLAESYLRRERADHTLQATALIAASETASVADRLARWREARSRQKLQRKFSISIMSLLT